MAYRAASITAGALAPSSGWLLKLYDFVHKQWDILALRAAVISTYGSTAGHLQIPQTVNVVLLGLNSQIFHVH